MNIPQCQQQKIFEKNENETDLEFMKRVDEYTKRDAISPVSITYGKDMTFCCVIYNVVFRYEILMPPKPEDRVKFTFE